MMGSLAVNVARPARTAMSSGFHSRHRVLTLKPAGS